MTIGDGIAIAAAWLGLASVVWSVVWLRVRSVQASARVAQSMCEHHVESLTGMSW